MHMTIIIDAICNIGSALGYAWNFVIDSTGLMFYSRKVTQLF